MDDCIALRPRPVYIRVQDLGGKASRDTYGSLRYVYLQPMFKKAEFRGRLSALTRWAEGSRLA